MSGLGVEVTNIFFELSGASGSAETGWKPAVLSKLELAGPAKRQLLVTAEMTNGVQSDATRTVKFDATPRGIISVSATGLLVPTGDGEVTLAAEHSTGPRASIKVSVKGANKARPINFGNQIVPIFTKTGCNGGGCHGKSSGQNGFRLSLLGFEPNEDYEHLVKEARGRRLFPASPDRSLLLLKGAAVLPHGGGKRLDAESDDYKLLQRWIAQGMPYGDAKDPAVARIEVVPRERSLAIKGEQQLVVLATYTDGSVEDVTRGALFEANDKEMARVDEKGLVTTFEQPGDVAVMVRYQSKVAVFRGAIPLGAPVEDLPAAANFVDDLVFKKLKKVGMPPSVICDDATFLRRATVDIAGRLPFPDEARKFLADTNTAKREVWVDRLIDTADYAENFANKWSSLLRNKRSDSTHMRGTYAFHAWVRDSLLANKPYDHFVREILAASGEISFNPPVAWYRQVREPAAQLEDCAQLFLGQRLQCAQCHHHPFEKWSQNDYYSFGAFFSQVARKQGTAPGEEIIFAKRVVPTIENKKTKRPMKPAGLGAPALDVAPDDDARQLLADWITSKDNPYFARSLVNRYWKHFFGRGLVDPEDDLRETNPPTNPELLNALARHFVAGNFDLKELVRTICRSHTYQLSAIPNKYNGSDRHNFSRYYPKRLTAEMLLDAINQVAKSETRFAGLPAGTRALQLPDNGFNSGSYFLSVFGRPEAASSCECERSQDASLAQSLHLLNAKDIQEKLAHDKGRADVLASDTKRGDEEKIGELYLWAYSRQPDAEELNAARAYLQRKTKGKDAKDLVAARRQAYEDLIWALLNTKEFRFNH